MLQSSFMFRGLEHTAIASPDPARLAEWYVQKLDFRINYTYDGNYFVRAADGSMLEIIPSQGERAPQQMKDPGIRHLAVERGQFRRGAGRTAQPGSSVSDRTIRQSRQPAGVLQRCRRQHPASDPARTPAPLIGITIAHQGFQGFPIPRLPHHVDRCVHFQHRNLDADPGAKLAGVAAFRLRVLAGHGFLPGQHSDCAFFAGGRRACRSHVAAAASWLARK